MDSVIGGKSDNQITFSGEPNIPGDNLPFQNLFLCPPLRITSAVEREDKKGNKYLDYYELDSNEVSQQNHHVHPLILCNNKEGFHVDNCVCSGYKIPTKDYYFCRKCCRRYHKECVESPLEIKHSYHHPKHSVKLFYRSISQVVVYCLHCRGEASRMVYECTLCRLYMHPVCAKEPVSFVLDQPKRHDHPLTFFTRQASLDCNVCGLTNEAHDPTYVCLKCNFVAHKDCAHFPHVIRISRHNHRVSFALSCPPRKWSCGVCGKNIDSEYGGYTCNKCNDYAVHSRCALREDVSDGKELEGVQEDDDIEENIEPFEITSEGIILHFSHEHTLRVETNKFYDELKVCQACIIPIYEGDFYSCMQCDFILHDTCANAPRRKQHALHPHRLTLLVINKYTNHGFKCKACMSFSSGFIYTCDLCFFYLDVRCASISTPLDYQGHQHPLFLTLSPREARYYCQACKEITFSGNALNCVECGFIICFSCVTLPYMARYKHDKHFLTLSFGDDETSKPDWCEFCEENLHSSRKKRFYMCNQGCSTILHVDCLLGKDRFMKPRLTIGIDRYEVQTFPNYTFSRPICDYCERRCGDNIFYRLNEKIFCSMGEACEIIYKIYRGVSSP